MSSPPSLNPQSILASLGISDAAQVEPVTGGADTLIWRVTWRGQVYALRVFRTEQVATCEREVAAMHIAATGGIPVPQVIQKRMWEDRPVLLLAWMPGKPLAQQLLEHPGLGWRLGQAFGQMQAALHKITVPATMEQTTWIDWAGDELELKRRLHELKSRQAALLHLDYHPLNVLAQASRISGVLDWANARVGDPRADFARTYTILRVEPYAPGGGSLGIAVLRRLLERAWRAGYTQAGGKLDDMALFYAWAGAVMIRDLGGHIGKPGQWVAHHHLDPVRRWRDAWKRRAGVRL